jgi:hypothetical protein
MNRTKLLFTRLAAVATVVLGLALVAAGQASAMPPPPDPGGSGGVPQGPSPAPVQQITDNSISALQWVLVAAALVSALAIGAALMRQVQRHRRQLAH